jgi:hypothetical protein
LVLVWNPIQRIRGSASQRSVPYVFRGSVIPLIWTAVFLHTGEATAQGTDTTHRRSALRNSARKTSQKAVYQGVLSPARAPGLEEISHPLMTSFEEAALEQALAMHASEILRPS